MLTIIDNEYREVDFKKYCPICKHAARAGAEYPCDECLEQGMNISSAKPINFKEREDRP